MPVGKRTTDERDNRGIPGPSKKKGKMKEGDDATTKKKRRPKRHFQVSDFPMGVGLKKVTASKTILLTGRQT